MSISPELSFPGKITPSTPQYPFGKARDITIPGDGTGTPWVAELLNDVFGFQQSLLDEAGIVPSGTPDEVGASQYYESFNKTSLMESETLANAVARKNVKVGSSIDIKEYTAGKGGGGRWDFITKGTTAGVDLPNGIDIVASTGVTTLVLVLRREHSWIDVSQMGADLTDPLVDDTLIAARAAEIGGAILVANGTLTLKPDTTAEINLIANTRFWGLGRGISTILFSESSNPATAVFGLNALDIDNICFEHLTLTSDAAAQGIFNLGTLDGNGVYGPDQAGNLYGVKITGCSNVKFNQVEVSGFNGEAGVFFLNTPSVLNYNTNVQILSCHGHNNRTTGFSLQACDGFTVLGGLYELNGLQVFDSEDSEGNPTSTVRTPTNFIDGGTGYGIVVGRTTTATRLKCKNGVVMAVRTRRNVRHGIDLHSGVGVDVIDCHSEDDLLTGFALQDIGPSLDNSFGDINVKGGSIIHTVYSENRGPLFDDSSVGVERADSNPIFIANIDSKIKNAIIDGVTVTGWRFRQISNYSATDTIMFISASANEVARVKGCTLIATEADFYPSKIIGVSANKTAIDGCIIKYGTRGTFDRAAFRFGSSASNTSFRNNDIEQISTFSTGTTQVARSVFDRTDVSDKPTFTGNNIKLTTQGVRGSLWETTVSNALWAYNGFLGINQGNTIDGEEYASNITGDKAFFISAAGAGRFDGTDASNAFNMANVANLQGVWDQMPICQGGLTLNYVDTKDFTAETGLAVPEFYRSMKVEMLGVLTDNTLSASKTAGFLTTGGFFITCPEHSDVKWKFLKIKSGGIVLEKPQEVLACAIENSSTSAGQVGVSFLSTNGRAKDTNFEKGQIGLQSSLGSSVVSQGNGSSGTNPTNGLNANGGVIMKNGTQPGGAELPQNGGEIR